MSAATPAEVQWRQRLKREGLPSPTRWANGPDAVYAVHDHPYEKVLVVISGSIVFTVGTERREVPLKAGDRLALPARTPHSALVGPEGVVCLEAHKDRR
jgi:mannose-6-phosphate isomerase-like protein (cupin superfamily)